MQLLLCQTMEDNKTDVLFTYDKLDVQAAVSYVTSEACGAISLFMGKCFYGTDLFFSIFCSNLYGLICFFL